LGRLTRRRKTLDASERGREDSGRGILLGVFEEKNLDARPPEIAGKMDLFSPTGGSGLRQWSTKSATRHGGYKPEITCFCSGTGRTLGSRTDRSRKSLRNNKKEERTGKTKTVRGGETTRHPKDRLKIGTRLRSKGKGEDGSHATPAHKCG